MSKDGPNILFLLSDEHSFRCFSHRDDATGEPVETPALGEIATDGTNFANAYCQMPLCAPSRLSLLTGREVRGAGAWRNGSVLPPRAKTIPETLGEAGYDTCLVGKMHLGGNRQFAGFEDRPYGDLTGGSGHQWEPLERADDRTIRDRTRDAGVAQIPESHLQEYNTVRESLSWIREHEAASEDPWFLTASFSRPHFPLTAPARYFRRYWDVDAEVPTDRLTEPKVAREGDTADHPVTENMIEGFRTEEIDDTERQRARAAYFACVEFLDDIVGEFLATLEREGYLDETIVVYASDHGELAGEHGIWWKHTWHEAATRVPLFVRTPAHRRGDIDPTTVETPVGLVDLFPTLCGFAGVEPPADIDGVDLSKSILTASEPERDPVVCDNLIPRWGDGTEFRLVRDGDYKYVRFRNAPEIFVDLAVDPLEQRNRASDPSALDADAREALKRLRRFVDETMDFDAAQRERERDEELLERYALEEETRSPSGNCYTMPNGTVVDADTPLYDSTVVIDEPESAFDNHPGE